MDGDPVMTAIHAQIHAAIRTRLSQPEPKDLRAK
jgi:hypothetical protein